MDTPRLHPKLTALARGLHIATLADVADAVNEMHELLSSMSGLTLAQATARLLALEAGVVLPNVAPVANNITASVDQDGSVVIPISATDSDGTIDLTSVVVTTAPAHGTHSINATNGDITYIPTTNYYGADSISYTVADNNGAVSNIATISITVNEIGAVVTAYTVAAGQTLYAGENPSNFIQYTTTGDSIYAGENQPVVNDIPYGDLAALKSAKLLPDLLTSSYTPPIDTNIDWSGNTGERSEIGLFPDDHSAYIAGAALDINLINSIADQPTPSTLSFGHHANIYWLPYLMTGDAKYVAHMEDQYIKICSKMGVPVNEFANWYESGRYFAWSLRTLVQLAYLQQQGVTTQTYYVDALEFTRNYLMSAVNTTDQAYQTWRVLKFNAVTYQSVGFTSWMESMVGIVINYVVQLGFSEWQPICDWQFVHLQRRVDYWGWKGVDSDHVWFYERAQDLGETAQITDYTTARAWSAKSGETVQQSWERVTAYAGAYESKTTYANYTDGLLFPADAAVDGTTYTYSNRAQYAYHWAALAARNGVTGAAELADSLYEKINTRGDVWGVKNSAAGYPHTIPLTPITAFNWTPARDASGIVTDASWQQLPISTTESPVVHRILGSDPVSELTTELITGGYNPANDDYGNGKVAGTFIAWTGLALDKTQNKAWMPWAGGHADSSCNGIWEFDINKLKWSVESLPSDPDAPGYEWSEAYKTSGSFTTYEGSYTLPDGRPPSQHTYGGVFKAGDLLISTRNRRYAYNLSTKQYETVTMWYETDGVTQYKPDIHNYTFERNGVVYGVMKKANVYGGFQKISDPSTNIVSGTSAPVYDDIIWNGSHCVAQLDSDRLIATSYHNKYAIFNMVTESWGASQTITGDLNTYPSNDSYNDELNAFMFIPTWGNSGSMLRQYMHGSKKWKWFVLDLETNIQTELTLTGATLQATPWIGNKAFIVDIGGITAMIYTSVNTGYSQTNIMRIA